MTPDPSRFSDLRISVIGAGRMGIRHIEAVKRLGMKVVGIADVTDTALESACSSQGLAKSVGYLDAHLMLRDLKPDACVIATTAPSHAELVTRAVDTGVRWVLCEKPMACSLEQARDMIRACERTGATLAINHQMRFMPQYNSIKSMIGTPDIGELSSIVVAGSNFGLAMNASHYFEMYRYIAGRPVEQVHAWLEEGTLPNPRGAQFQDRSGRLLARSGGGPALYIDFSGQSGHGLQVTYICRHAQITVDELAGHVRVVAREEQYRPLPTTRYGMPATVRELAIEPADTVQPTMRLWQAMLAGESYPDGHAGLHALSCLVAAHTSHRRQGAAVGLADADLPQDQVFPWA